MRRVLAALGFEGWQMSDNRKSSAPANMGAELAEYDRHQQLASMPGAVWSRGPRKGMTVRKATPEEHAAHAKLLRDRAGDVELDFPDEVELTLEDFNS
jgi:hypothetical protein